MTAVTFAVEFTDDATEQAERAAAWWRMNRPAAPELFDIELAYALDLLAKMPPLSQVWAEVEGKPVRKVRLPRCDPRTIAVTVAASVCRRRAGCTTRDRTA